MDTVAEVGQFHYFRGVYKGYGHSPYLIVSEHTCKHMENVEIYGLLTGGMISAELLHLRKRSWLTVKIKSLIGISLLTIGLFGPFIYNSETTKVDLQQKTAQKVKRILNN